MINIKLSGIAGVIAFVVSLLLGIIGGSRISMVLLKALIFAVVFMVLSGGIYALISMYLPDLLSPDDMEPQDYRGSRVDISLDDQGEEGLNSDYSPEGDENSAGIGENQDILNENRETSPDSLDQNRQDGYTIKGDVEIMAGMPEEAASSPESSGAGSVGSVEELPDFDSMATAFGGSSGEIPETAVARTAPGGNSGLPAEVINAQFIGGPLKNKNIPELEEKFDIKEMASAIQTILKREDKG